jgi:hypothetical protein
VSGENAGALFPSANSSRRYGEIAFDGSHATLLNQIMQKEEADDDTGSNNSSVRDSMGSVNSSLDGSSEAALCDFQMIMISNPMRDYANFVVNR